jgi:DNA-binding NarL/FixJ family response regulator
VNRLGNPKEATIYHFWSADFSRQRLLTFLRRIRVRRLTPFSASSLGVRCGSLNVSLTLTLVRIVTWGAQLSTVVESIADYRGDQDAGGNVVAFVAVVEGRPFLRECIRRSMQVALAVPVVTYSTLSELGAQLPDSSIGLVVLSLIEGTSEACATALKDLSEFASELPVIALASTNDVDLARAAIGCGAKGFIPVTMGFEIAIEVMRFVLAGGTYVPPDCLLVGDQRGLRGSTTSPRPYMLTSRELSVVRAIQQGKSNKIIANELNMCLSTVKVHVRNVMRKLNAKNRTEVAMKS